MFKILPYWVWLARWPYCITLCIVFPSLPSFLQAAPDHASRAQQREFQTTILSVLMEHLLAADILIGEQAAISMSSNNAGYATVVQSVFYLASRIVDKLWHGKTNLCLCKIKPWINFWTGFGVNKQHFNLMHTYKVGIFTKGNEQLWFDFLTQHKLVIMLPLIGLDCLYFLY